MVYAARTFRERVRDMWAAVRDRRRDYGAFEEESSWPDEGPEQHDALVPVGPPREPRSSGAVALPLPDPEPEVTDAYGREDDDDDESDRRAVSG